MMFYDHDLSGGGWTLMIASMVFFWALLIAGVVLLVRHLLRDAQRLTSTAGPEGLLAERFARGEIDAEEYQQRLNTLRAEDRPRVTA
jgi:putative membrane protein